MTIQVNVRENAEDGPDGEVVVEIKVLPHAGTRDMANRNVDLGPMRSYESFASMLTSILHRKGISNRAFAQLAKCSHTLINLILDEEKTPPVSDLPEWARILELDHEWTAEFTRLGHSARAKGKKDTKPYVTIVEEVNAGLFKLNHGTIDLAAEILVEAQERGLRLSPDFHGKILKFRQMLTGLEEMIRNSGGMMP